MSVKGNNKTISSINYGSTSISKMYKGASLVFGGGGGDEPKPCFAVTDDITTYTATTYIDVYDNKREKWYKLNNLGQYEKYGVLTSYSSTGDADVPAGYTKLEYIENQSYGYIDTGYKPTQDVTIIADFEWKQSNANAHNVLYGIDLPPYRYELFMGNSSHRFDYGSNNTNISAFSDGRHIVKQAKNILYCDDVKWGELSTTTFTSTLSLIIFNGNNAINNYGDWKTSWPGKYKLYSFQIYEGDTLVRDYVPCINDSSVVGLYDKIGKQFYTSANDQTFIAGDETGGSGTDINDITYYTGKLIIYDGHEYKWTGSEWSDLGETTLQGYKYWMWYYTANANKGDGAFEISELDLVDSGDNDIDLTAIAANPTGFTNETYPNLFDNDSSTKWCHAWDTSSNYVIWSTENEVSPSKFSITTASCSTSPYRMASAWKLFASNTEETARTGSTWTEILSGTDNYPTMAVRYTRFDFDIDTSVYGSSKLPQEYDTKVAPSNNVEYDTLEELKLMECPWDGMKAKVGDNHYIYHIDGGWAQRNKYIEIDYNNGEWMESTTGITDFDVYMSAQMYNQSGNKSFKITFCGYPEFEIHLNTYDFNYSYDKCKVWALDSATGTTVLAQTDSSTYNASPDNIEHYKPVIITNDGDEHFVWVTYNKQYTYSSNNYRGYCAIEQYEKETGKEWRLRTNEYLGSNGTYYEKYYEYITEDNETWRETGDIKQGNKLETADRIGTSEYLATTHNTNGTSSAYLTATQKVYVDVITPDGVQRSTGYYKAGDALTVTDNISQTEYLGSNPYYQKIYYNITLPNGSVTTYNTSYYKQGEQLESVNRISTTEYLKVDDAYYQKVYVDPITPDGTQRNTTNYIQGEQLTSYTQDDGDTVIQSYKRYHKLRVYVTVEGNAVKTTDWVLGDYIEDVDRILPEGYTQVEYIKVTDVSTGLTNSINLQYCPHMMHDITFDVNIDTISSNQYKWLIRTTDDEKGYRVFIGDSGFHYGLDIRFGEKSLQRLIAYTDTFQWPNQGQRGYFRMNYAGYSYKLHDDAEWTIGTPNGTDVPIDPDTIEETDKYSTYNALLFGYKGNWYNPAGRVYGIIIKEYGTETLLHKFIPGKEDSSSTLGLYDIATDTWCPVYTNSHWTAGDEGVFDV